MNFDQQCLAWDCSWANFDNLLQMYGTCQCTKNGFWPLLPFLSLEYHDDTSQND